MARKFLYIVAGVVILILALMLALRLWSEKLTKLTFVPDVPFAGQPPVAPNAYDKPDMWISRPGVGERDPALWLPTGVEASEEAKTAAVFFVHPTSYFERKGWNAPLSDRGSRELADIFVRGMASPFNANSEIWAPRYRQATFGAFLTSEPPGKEALGAAYADVLIAFDSFIAAIGKDRPIVLAGHSQGAFQLRRLMKERIAGTPLQRRIAAAYLIGWPISLDHDLPEMGLPACTMADQAGCVVGWLTFAEPAEPEMVLNAWHRQTGLDGQTEERSAFLCTNPLTGTKGGKAPASANLGTLVPNLEAKTGTLAKGVVGARCREDGFLSIGEPPVDLALGPYVMPGNNYHLFDMTLFWSNLRADVATRLAAWKSSR